MSPPSPFGTFTPLPGWQLYALQMYPIHHPARHRTWPEHPRWVVTLFPILSPSPSSHATPFPILSPSPLLAPHLPPARRRFRPGSGERRRMLQGILGKRRAAEAERKAAAARAREALQREEAGKTAAKAQQGEEADKTKRQQTQAAAAVRSIARPNPSVTPLHQTVPIFVFHVPKALTAAGPQRRAQRRAQRIVQRRA